MVSSEKVLEIAQKLPGFYGYRPEYQKGVILIKELIFRLEDGGFNYEFILFFENNRCIDGIVDVRFEDGSIVQLIETEKEFDSITRHKTKLCVLFG